VTTASAFDNKPALESALRARSTELARCVGPDAPAEFAVAFLVKPLTGKPTGGIESTSPRDLHHGPTADCLRDAIRSVKFPEANDQINDDTVSITVAFTVSRPAATTPARPRGITGDAALVTRLNPEKQAALPGWLAGKCEKEGAVPREVTFELNVRRDGPVLEATLVSPTGQSKAMTLCLQRSMTQWPFDPAAANTTGHLRVTR
jgi:hypothetical protein